MNNIINICDVIDYGCGFPIKLLDVETIQLDNGDTFYNIDYFQLVTNIAKVLAIKETPITGAELRFIRLHLDLGIEAFANLIGSNYNCISQYENMDSKFTQMSNFLEIVIRLFLLEKLGCTDTSVIYQVIRLPLIYDVCLTYIPMEFVPPKQHKLNVQSF